MKQLFSRSTLAFSLVYGLSIAVALLSFNAVNRYLTTQAIQVRSTGIDGCAEVSKNTFTTTSANQTSVITDINQTVYQKCLELKNIQ